MQNKKQIWSKEEVPTYSLFHFLVPFSYYIFHQVYFINNRHYPFWPITLWCLWKATRMLYINTHSYNTIINSSRSILVRWTKEAIRVWWKSCLKYGISVGKNTFIIGNCALITFFPVNSWKSQVSSSISKIVSKFRTSCA